VTELGQALGDQLLDEQIATALLTGIVSATNRFSNERTNSQTMSMSAVLMTAGANQQLVTSKLAELVNQPVSDVGTPVDDASGDGTIEIDHAADSNDDKTPAPARVLDQPAPEPRANYLDDNLPDRPDETKPPDNAAPEPTNDLSPGSKLMTEPPTMGGTLTANSSAPGLDPVTDPLSIPASESPQLLDHQTDQPPAGPGSSPKPLAPPEPKPFVPPAPLSSPPSPAAPASGTDNTLTQLETAVNSPHLGNTDLNDARSEVDKALGDPKAMDAAAPEPIKALHAQPLGEELHPADPAGSDTSDQVVITQDGSLLPAPKDDSPSAESTDDEDRPSGAPPPVPPPIPFQFGSSSGPPV
jgi:hypothetical protein